MTIIVDLTFILDQVFQPTGAQGACVLLVAKPVRRDSIVLD